MGNIWEINGSNYYPSYESVNTNKLENSVFLLKKSLTGFYLTKISNRFDFDYKIYGIERKFIERILKTYDNTTGNLGVLLNGLKGTGKTVSAKVLSNKLNQPTILINNVEEGCVNFINSISQDVTIFVDEYEKIFTGENKGDLLTIMDGALNSQFRRVFLLTTNELRVDDNLLDRPSRVRYLKKFDDLPIDVIEELTDDLLEHMDLRLEVIDFISKLEKITVDIVKMIINEVNIHNESPYEFKDVFNAKLNTDSYRITMIDKNQSEVLLGKDLYVYPRPNYDNDDLGRNLEIGSTYIGKITKILGENSLQIKPFNEELGESVVLHINKTYVTHKNYAYIDGYSDNSLYSNDEILKTFRIEDKDE